MMIIMFEISFPFKSNFQYFNISIENILFCFYTITKLIIIDLQLYKQVGIKQGGQVCEW